MAHRDPFSLLLSGLELSDTQVYEPYIRALLGTDSHYRDAGGVESKVVVEEHQPLLLPAQPCPRGESHMQTLIFYQLGFNQNYYTFALILLIKIVLCSKFP